MNAIAKTLLMITALAALSGSAFAKTKKAAGIKVNWKEVPAAVQTTIQSNAAGGKVVEVNKQTANGALFYYAEVKGTDHKWTTVYVTDAGALIKVEPDKARNKRKHKPLFGSESFTGPAPFA
jgi:urease gamma subunit